MLIIYKFQIYSQLRDLLEKNPEKHTELLEVIQKFRDDEMEHHDTGLKHDAEKVIIHYCVIPEKNDYLFLI
jgi:demethoxyubiquinone hydroxylase (CLK1/Coq7/Cat5 family)